MNAREVRRVMVRGVNIMVVVVCNELFGRFGLVCVVIDCQLLEQRTQKGKSKLCSFFV